MDSQQRPGWNPPMPADLARTPPPSPDVVSPGPRRSRVGTGIAVAAIAIGALGVAGTAYATNSSPTPSAAPSAGGLPPGYAAPGSASGRPQEVPGGGPAGVTRPGYGLSRGPGRGHVGLGPGIHGSFVVPKQGGGYQTVDTQVGVVTGVSSTSITVKSTDGFTRTYAVDSATMVDAQRDGIAAVRTGDEVGVVAVENGSTRTAVRIVDRTQLRAARQQIAPARPSAAAYPGGPGTA